jgi:hypothetical protein
MNWNRFKRYTLLLFLVFSVSLFTASALISMFLTSAHEFKNVYTFPVRIFGNELGAILCVSFAAGFALAIANPDFDAKGMLLIVGFSVVFSYIIIFCVISLPVILYSIEVSPDFWYANIGKIFLSLPPMFLSEFAAVFVYRALTGE